jgi:hypothetical protein
MFNANKKFLNKFYMHQKQLLIVFGCLALAGVAAISGLMILSWLSHPFGSATVIQSQRPLGLAEARRLTGLDFPDSAKAIRFAHFSEMTARETFLRFEANPADCVAYAERMIHRKLSRSNGPVTRPFASSSILETDWFDPLVIRNGMGGSLDPRRGPMVWVDMDRGVFYFMQTD